MSRQIPAALAHRGACSVIGPERFKAADRHHGAPLAFNLRLTTEQTHTFNNPLPYLWDGKVRRGISAFIPLVTSRCLSKVCLLKIERRSAFQHEKPEKHVGSCARARLRAKLGGRGSTLRAVLFCRLFSNPVTAVPVWSVWEFAVSSTNKCFMYPKTLPSRFLRNAVRFCAPCLWVRVCTHASKDWKYRSEMKGFSFPF